jgi:hypothetical protein
MGGTGWRCAHENMSADRAKVERKFPSGAQFNSSEKISGFFEIELLANRQTKIEVGNPEQTM